MCSYRTDTKQKTSGKINLYRLPYIIFLYSYPIFIPANPINAIASRPAVINAIGTPFIAFGTFESASCSRIPAKIINAKVNPNAVDTA